MLLMRRDLGQFISAIRPKCSMVSKRTTEIEGLGYNFYTGTDETITKDREKPKKSENL